IERLVPVYDLKLGSLRVSSSGTLPGFLMSRQAVAGAAGGECECEWRAPPHAHTMADRGSSEHTDSLKESRDRVLLVRQNAVGRSPVVSPAVSAHVCRKRRDANDDGDGQ